MEPYDVMMLLVLLAATIFGAWKGLAWQIASLASVFASYFVAFSYREPVAGMLNFQEPWNRFLAMLILYLATSLLIWIGFRLVRDAIDRVKLREFDRQIGALVGLAKGILLCVIITLFAVSLTGDQTRRRIVGSYSGFYIAQLLDRSHTMIPEELHDVLHPYMHSLDERLDDHPPHTEQPANIQGPED